VQVSVPDVVVQSQPGRPFVIAHRGGAQESTENTIGAFHPYTGAFQSAVSTAAGSFSESITVISAISKRSHSAADDGISSLGFDVDG
jgi:hypothetical protein